MANEKEVHELLVSVLAYIRQEQLVVALPKKVLKPDLLKNKVESSPTKKLEEKIEKSPISKWEKKSSSFDKSSLQKLIVETLPEVRICNHTPNNAKAKIDVELCKKKYPQVGLIAFHQKQLPFLQKLARAINHHLVPTKIWKANRVKPLGSLRLFLATQADILSHSSLKKECRESPKPTLFEIPLLFLSPIEAYEKNPALKRALWNHLCQILQ